MPLYSIILMHLMAAYTVLVEPLLRINFFRILKKQLIQDASARILFYRTQVLWEWSWVVVLVLIVLPLPDSLKWLGITLPNPLGWLFTLALLLGFGMSVVLLRRNPRAMEAMQHSLQDSAILLPSTPPERNWYIAMTITTGICEELLYRGFLLFYLRVTFPSLDMLIMAIISGVIYGLSRAYQGYRGALQAAIMGFSFFILYYISGLSLLPAMVFHILADLRKMWLWQPEGEKKKKG